MSYIVNDCVHNIFSLPSYVSDIINTKEFQRLYHLKQLGSTSYVFKSAIHSRAQHCIGTAFLCQRLLDILEQNSNKKIDELHRKCVILAGLLHDLGHGPFSNLWEGVVCQGTDKTWTHEDQSLKMIEHMIDTNNIKLAESHEDHKFAMLLMTSLITGDTGTWKKLLKPEEMFITEIVSNEFCSIDVDKCDYILRDHFHVGELVILQPFIDFMKRARVVNDKDGTSHIGYHANDFSLIENLFFNRAHLHKEVYQFHQVAGAERMVKDICVKGDAGGVTIDSLPLTEVHRDGNAYLKLDDSVLDLIHNWAMKNEALDEAKQVLDNLTNDKLYTMVHEASDDGKEVFEALVRKFGSIFCCVDKVIPSAEVPKNIPLYNDDGQNVVMISNLQLSFKSKLIFCVDSDPVVVSNVKKFIDSLNNNI